MEWVELRLGDCGQVDESSALVECAVMHGDEAEAARLRAELARLVECV